ncbi:hypothetical protein AB0M20_03940 [Actinoplanes sp. NPDC051633]|uniref:hypothetical protein n=1 Tax=Actinoplanes sp. NPDC051633 TaxID=3155670 RepID=UPI00341B56F5
MSRMGTFLVDLVSATIGAAAGAAGTVAGGPVAGAAAAVAGSRISGALITAFVGAQGDQLDSLESMNRNLGGRLALVEAGLFRVGRSTQSTQDEIRRLSGELKGVGSEVRNARADLQVQLEEPWQSAIVYLQHAAMPEQQRSTRQEYLRHARAKLIEAHSTARNDAKRGLIGQRLAATAIMLGDIPSARQWLLEAYPSVSDITTVAAREVQVLFTVDWSDLQVVSRIMELANLIEHDAARFSRADRVNLRSSPEEFWARFLRSSPPLRRWITEDRSDISASFWYHLRYVALTRQVLALTELRRMKTDLDMTRQAYLSLGGDRSTIKSYRLHVDILPLRPTIIRLDEVKDPG